MGWAAVAAIGAQIAGSVIGARSQERQARLARQQQQEFLDFSREIYEEGAPLRDLQFQDAEAGVARREAVSPTLLDSILNPTSSEVFKRAATEGLDLISAEASTRGSPSSGNAQLSRGRFIGDLTAREQDARFNRALQFAGLGGPVPTDPSGGQAIVGVGQATAGIANLRTNEGASQAGLYSSIGRDVGDFILTQFGKKPGGTV